MLLVNYGLICFMRVSSRQGAQYFATLLASFEESLPWTSSVRQVVPPERSSMCITQCTQNKL